MEILCISNGHGEDEIGVRICRALQKLGHSILALPLVGEGVSYQRQGFAVLKDVTGVMPTGGFLRMDGKELWRDVQAGLLSLTWRQFRAAWGWSRPDRLILAVGDIVPLAFAWLCSWRGTGYVFMATAKSEYYWRDRGQRVPWGGSIFYPWERWLMGQKSCRGVFVRDQLTADWLRRHCRLRVNFLGNPMMDDLEPKGLTVIDQNDCWIVTILPGSRPPEAYHNFSLLRQLAESWCRTLKTKVIFLVALAPNIDREILVTELVNHGWQNHDRFYQENAELLLVDSFTDCLHLCHFGLAMAGTATEQLVGLGKPVFSLPGAGPQFTPTFAQDQVHLLGSAVTLLQSPADGAAITDRILHDHDFFQNAILLGQERMGSPGASDRIAQMIDNCAAIPKVPYDLSD
ncbi:MAG: hypothetical protein CV045_11680 [Cyanobacteria bacterium M5B4]|nr:MAG: hypothetical protein CV045_11680 [Cyanobacteria bacterium M5B4]